MSLGMFVWALVLIAAIGFTVAVMERRPVLGAMAALGSCGIGLGFVFVLADMVGSGVL